MKSKTQLIITGLVISLIILGLIGYVLCRYDIGNLRSKNKDEVNENDDDRIKKIMDNWDPKDEETMKYIDKMESEQKKIIRFGDKYFYDNQVFETRDEVYGYIIMNS